MTKKIVAEHAERVADLSALETELADELAKMAALKRRIRELHQLARYAAGSENPCPIHNHHHRMAGRAPTTASLISEALTKSAGPLSIAELVAAIDSLGWVSDSEDKVATVRSAAHRMEKKNKLKKTEEGRYEL